MLSIVPNLPAYVLGIRATDEVTTEDIQNILVPGLQAMVDRYGEIHYLLVLETSIGNFTAGAWWQDMKVGIKHFTRWKKIAVVTEEAGVEKFTDLFSLLVPGEARGFTHSELVQALQWIEEK